MQRIALIERVKRQILNGFAGDDSTITDNLVNLWVNDGLAIAAKKNYTDNLQLEGIGFVNNSFFSTFKGIAITKDEQFLYKFILPSIPLGIGATEGIARVVFKDTSGNISFPAIMLSEYQVALQRSMRSIPNKILCYSEGGNCFAITPIIMTDYTASVTLISGGDSTNLNSTINIPDDYMNIIIDYCKLQLSFEVNQVSSSTNDGQDAIRVA